MADIVITTGEIDEAYDILGPVFAVAAVEQMDGEADAFDKLNRLLADRCREKGGNAVAFTRYDVKTNLKRELWAFGTAVRTG